MAQYPQSMESAISKFVIHLDDDRRLTESTLRFYRSTITTVFNTFRDGLGKEVMPWDVTLDNVRWLADELVEKNLTVSTVQGYMAALAGITKFYGVTAVADANIRYPSDTRPNVRWIPRENAIRLARQRLDPMTDLIIHCELCLGMRRVEVIRLKPTSFDGSVIYINGKGPRGGKLRKMPYHPATDDIYRRWTAERARLISAAQSVKPTVKVPETLLLWQRGKALGSYDPVRGTAISNRVKDAGIEAGIDNLSNHMCRRTFGRTLWRDGVKIETIAAMLGHDSVDQTLKYIGADLFDMSAAMKQFSL